MTDPTGLGPALPARPRGMPDGVDPTLPDGAFAATFECAACGAWAMRLVVRTKGPAEELGGEPAFLRGTAWLELESGLGGASFRMTDEGAPPDSAFVDRTAILAAIGEGTPEAIYRVDLELVPNWCPRCPAVYCRDHWRTWEVFDPDFPAWHEETRGSCPNGHERMLSD